MTAIRPHNTDVVDEPWDGGAVVASLPNGENQDSWVREFAWYDGTAPDQDGDGYPDAKNAWKFPHHQTDADGVPGAANVNALRNALARIPQAEIPSQDDAGVRAHVQHHLDAFDAKEPGEQPGDSESGEAAQRDVIGVPQFIEVQAELHIRADAPDERIIEGRIVPFGVPTTVRDRDQRTLKPVGRPYREVIRGVSDFDPSRIALEVQHRGPIAGKGVDGHIGADGAYVAFRALNTTAGNDAYELAKEGFLGPLSVEIEPESPSRTLPDGTVERMAVIRRVALVDRGAYSGAQITAVRADAQEGQMAEAQEAPVSGASFDSAALVAQMRDAFGATVAGFEERFGGRLDKLEEQNRQQIAIPKPDEPKKDVDRKGSWMRTAIGILSGERQTDAQLRDLADLITSDNVGIVPPTYSQELIGVIAAVRPFMESTRKLPMPATGMSLILPKLVTRPTVDTQETEKTQVSSTATEITTATFTAITEAGGGDLSLQILKRSSPEFLALYLELLAEAYAVKCDHDSTAALLADGGINTGGTIDPTSLSLATAYSNSFGAIKRGPDSIWLSTAGYGAFLDANYSIGGAAIPLYPALSPTGQVGGGAVGSIRNLNAFVVPAFDDQSVDAVIGPSRGFAWAEDGTYTLQVDVPAKAGRDVALVGMIWPAVMYGAAFTTFTLGA